jgi:hypothetical protein
MKAKSILVIVLTLVIGFILGMLTSAEMRYRRLKPVRVYFSEERFRDGFYKAIQPNEQQKEKIDLILDKYARINSEVQNNFRRELDANMKDFRKELDSNLTKDQLERLKQMDDRRQEMIRKNRQFHGNDSLNYRSERWSHPEGRGPGRFHAKDSTDLPDSK